MRASCGDDTTASMNLLATLIRFLAIIETRRELLLRRAALQDSDAA
jgi:hypothetical protein